MEIQGVLKELSQLIMLGKLEDVRVRLGRIKIGDIPRRHLPTLANMAWRSGSPTLAIQMLRKFVRPPKGTLIQPHPAESMEYAAALTRLGGFKEARELLATIDPAQLPKKWLYEGFIYMSRWEYDQAVHPLRLYQLTLPKGQYDWAVATVNLAATLIVLNQTEEARECLDQVIPVLRQENRLRLLANVYELLSQIYVHQRQIPKAIETIRIGEGLIGDHDFFEALFFRKWEAVAAVYSEDAKQATEKLTSVRKQAVKMNHWETIRECDLYLCYLRSDDHLFKRLYFGTPYPLYRQRICKTLSIAPPKDNSCWLDIEPSNQQEAGSNVIQMQNRLDCSGGTFNGKAFIKSQGSVYHRLLLVLLSDLYRPIRLTTLHSEIYPGIYYDLDSTPNKLYQILQRLRVDVEAGDVPMQIDFSKSNLALKFLAPLKVLVYKEYHSGSRIAQLLKVHFPQQLPESISSTELAAQLGCSLRQAQRILNQARNEGLLEFKNKNKAA